MITLEIPPQRFSRYLVDAGHDVNVAMRLYAWNMELGAAFFPVLASVEVALREPVASRLQAVYGSTWWAEPTFHDLLGGKGKAVVLRARDERVRRKGQVTHGCMTAELTLGFWSKMFMPKYGPALWSPLSSAFPHLPSSIELAQLEARATQIADFRNRVFHHEPIFQRNISQDYADALELLEWLAPRTAVWLRPSFRVMAVMRTRPRRKP